MKHLGSSAAQQSVCRSKNPHACASLGPEGQFSCAVSEYSRIHLAACVNGNDLLTE